MDLRAVDSNFTAPPLTAHRADWERSLLADDHALGDLHTIAGGPFHVMAPDQVAANLREFDAAMAAEGVDGAIYYARKANKAACVIGVCARADAGVDVSSTGELRAALGGGVRGPDLMVTGPAKSDELLWLASRHGALIAIDAIDELDRLSAIAPAAVRVLLRVSAPGSVSRFGLTNVEIERAVAQLTEQELVRLDGFSFHLTGYDPAARAELAGTLIDRCRWARSLGHPATTVSIGGGFAVDYVRAKEWATYTSGDDRQWFLGGHGIETCYPYHSPVAGAAMLTQILRTNGLASRLRQAGIRLAVEPGRSLLDRAGVSVFAVQGVKTRTERDLPYRMITVDGSSLSLSEQWFASEYLPDPVLWPLGRPGTEPVPTCVGGVTCLESDFISRRRLPLTREPVVGDLLVYPNTAGYQMDSNESTFQDHPIPPKFVMHRDHRWTLDQPIGGMQ